MVCLFLCVILCCAEESGQSLYINTDIDHIYFPYQYKISFRHSKIRDNYEIYVETLGDGLSEIDAKYK